MLSTFKAKRKSKKGFTLVELVIVIAIIAILAAIAIPTVNNVVDTANINTDKANAQTVELTLKSADAEITAQTRSDINRESNVEDILKAYGVDINVDEKGKSKATWAYANNKIFCDKETHKDAKDLKSSIALKDVITHPNDNEN